MSLTRPWLWLAPKLAHDLAPLALEMCSIGQEVLGLQSDIPRIRPRTFRGLDFANPLGLAGGADKNGESIEAWWKMGLGFIEVGTVTPEPQGPNPGEIIARNASVGALWNRMGFPNDGAQSLRSRLMDLPRPRLSPLFVNLGKNRSTPLESSLDDFIRAAEMVGDAADVWVINISSPNTKGLRDLFQPARLSPLLGGWARHIRSRPHLDRPWLLKLSPDLANVEAVVRAAVELGVDGFISANTTLSRPTNPNGAPLWMLPAEGGLSGEPLRPLAEAQLEQVVAACGAERRRLLVVSVGGVAGPEDITRRLALGADLVQAYSALVLQGPWAARRWLNQLSTSMGEL